jgi:hypothetical protein
MAAAWRPIPLSFPPAGKPQALLWLPELELRQELGTAFGGKKEAYRASIRPARQGSDRAEVPEQRSADSTQFRSSSAANQRR